MGMGPLCHVRPSSALYEHPLWDLLPADKVDGAAPPNCLIKSWGSLWQEGHEVLRGWRSSSLELLDQCGRQGWAAGKQEEVTVTNSKKSLETVLC